MRRAFLILAFLIATVVAPGRGASDPAAYLVFKGETPVLRIIDQPGPLASTALPPPGFKPPEHPFLSASALAPFEENELRRILDASGSTAEFLRNLEQAGYRIQAD